MNYIANRSLLTVKIMKYSFISMTLLIVLASCQEQKPTPTTENQDIKYTDPIKYSGLTHNQHKNLNPDDAIKYLKTGNAQFAEEQVTTRSHDIDQRKNTASQYPFATVLSCFDSRIPVEDIFNKGIGDLLVLRVAGNIVNPEILGSMEYGAKDLGSKVIMVLGHKNCTSVQKALEKDTEGNVASISMQLKAAVAMAKNAFGPKSANNKAYYEEITKTNVQNSMREIRRQSPILDKMIANGEIKLIGGVYDMNTGQIEYIN